MANWVLAIQAVMLSSISRRVRVRYTGQSFSGISGISPVCTEAVYEPIVMKFGI
jgi:hypothetical protein